MAQLRHTWEFTYPVAELLKGASAKIKWHESRFDFWILKQGEIKKTIGEKGIVIDEGAGGEGYMSSSLRGPTARIDSQLQDHLRQATSKVMVHREKLIEYRSWRAIFEAQKSTSSYPLQHNDWTFFFSEVNPQQDQEEDIVEGDF